MEKIIARRRRTGRPFERSRAPGIIGREVSFAQGPKYVADEKDSATKYDQRSHGSQHIQRIPPQFRLVRINASRHAFQAELVHWKERKIEPDKKQPKIPLAGGVIKQ